MLIITVYEIVAQQYDWCHAGDKDQNGWCRAGGKDQYAVRLSCRPSSLVRQALQCC